MVSETNRSGTCGAADRTHCGLRARRAHAVLAPKVRPPFHARGAVGCAMLLMLSVWVVCEACCGCTADAAETLNPNP